MPRTHKIEDYRNFGIMAHIDAGQDHDDRADPLLHGQDLQDRRGARRRRDHGFHGAGAGARHHHHVGRHHLLLGTASASTSSTRQATSTSPSRWSARCACSTAPCACSTATRAWSRRPRRSGARATSTACRASSSPTRWIRPAPTSTCASPTSRRSWAPGRCRCSSRSARESSFKGVVDLLKMKAIIWDGDDKDSKFTRGGDPRRPRGQGRRIPRADDRGRRRDGRRRHGRLPRRQGARRRHAEAADPQGDGQGRLLSDAVRLGLQVQGRAAAARCRGRLPALAGRSRGLQGDRRQDRRAGRAQAARQRSAVHAGVQDHGRPARRLDHVLPRLFGHGARAAWRWPTPRATGRSGSGACISCTPTSASRSTRPTPATSSRSPGLKDTRTGETLSDPNKPVLLEKMEFPNPVIEMKVEPKTKADVEKMGMALPSWRPRIPRSA